MSIISKLEGERIAFLERIATAQQTKTLAPDGWYDSDDLESESYALMLELILGLDPNTLLEAVQIIAADPLFEEYLDDETDSDRVNALQEQLESKYGVVSFGLADLFIVLSGLHESVDIELPK